MIYGINRSDFLKGDRVLKSSFPEENHWSIDILPDVKSVTLALFESGNNFETKEFPNKEIAKKKICSELKCVNKGLYLEYDFGRVYIDNFQIEDNAYLVGGYRDKRTITKSLRKIIDTITVSKTKKSYPTGSFKYKIHKYPSDIDIFEIIDICCSVEEAIKKLKIIFKDMMYDLKSVGYLSAFKAGRDNRYNKSIDKLRNEKLISEKEYMKLKNSDADYVSDYLRDLSLIKWDSSDVINGHKKLALGKIITLDEVLLGNNLIKIDVWAKVNNRFIEVTNLLALNVVDGYGDKITSLTRKMPDYESSMKFDIQFFYKKRDYLKTLKRIWTLALYKKNEKLLNDISPIFGSSISALHQISSECEVLSNMIIRLDNIPLEEMLEQIDEFKVRIDQISNLPDNVKLYNKIDNILNVSLEEKISGLEDLMSFIDEIVNREIKFMYPNIASLVKKSLD